LPAGTTKAAGKRTKAGPVEKERAWTGPGEREETGIYHNTNQKREEIYPITHLVKPAGPICVNAPTGRHIKAVVPGEQRAPRSDMLVHGSRTGQGIYYFRS